MTLNNQNWLTKIRFNPHTFYLVSHRYVFREQRVPSHVISFFIKARHWQAKNTSLLLKTLMMECLFFKNKTCDNGGLLATVVPYKFLYWCVHFILHYSSKVSVSFCFMIAKSAWQGLFCICKCNFKVVFRYFLIVSWFLLPHFHQAVQLDSIYQEKMNIIELCQFVVVVKINTFWCCCSLFWKSA